LYCNISFRHIPHINCLRISTFAYGVAPKHPNDKIHPGSSPLSILDSGPLSWISIPLPTLPSSISRVSLEVTPFILPIVLLIFILLRLNAVLMAGNVAKAWTIEAMWLVLGQRRIKTAASLPAALAVFVKMPLDEVESRP
jgi:hypothetical protein